MKSEPIVLQSSPHEAEAAFLRFEDVEKTYDGQIVVVKRLNLSIRRGEFLTLLGPSGSGKTTALMMLAGFELPSAGRILLEGRRVDGLPPHQRNIGVVFQNYALFPHVSVAENVAFPLQMRRLGKSEIGERVARALDMVQMGRFADRRPAQLSGGQQQRVALARALVFEPSLVLMDEPLGALDKQLREHMQLEIKHLHARLGLTVVYVTHDQSEALTMSDRIAVFSDGVVQQIGGPGEIYDAPTTAFVACFVGDNNILSGTVESMSADGCCVVLGGVAVDAIPCCADLRAGSETTLSIRPERILIAPQEGVANRMTARVQETIYLGDHIRVRVAALGREDIVIKVPNGREPPVELRPGVSIPIGWHPADGRALKRDRTLPSGTHTAS